MNTSSSTIVQRLWNYCNVLRDERRLSVVGKVPCGDDTLFGDEVESAVRAGLARVARLRHIVPVGEAVLRSTACPAHGVVRD